MAEKQQPSGLEVHELSDDPLECWEEVKKTQPVQEKVEPMPLDTPIYPDKVRFVVVSDTEGKTWPLRRKIPPGDVLLHCGDMSWDGDPNEIIRMNDDLGNAQDHPFKICIAGNHDLTFDPHFWWPRIGWQTCGDRWGLDVEACHEWIRKDYGCEQMHELLSEHGNANWTYLFDSATEVYGIKIYGSPWQPIFGWWAFNERRGDRILYKWDKIPADTDILMTHGPPLGFCDETRGKDRAGCAELLTTIQKRVKPKYHCFGHIHEAYGQMTDGQTTFINAATCNLDRKPDNPPVIFDMPLPPGKTKEEYVEEKKKADVLKKEAWEKTKQERRKKWAEQRAAGTYRCYTH
ncbi:unnamed protein product [Owenia fusiformis]|uniref:Uncharacterized protein n=1 Tax=Owenia fusiformis TaxID=6347 RepID=A0A8J1XLR5_OWEFU|nr:unnamed protein product [Owenia fusiformis]